MQPTFLTPLAEQLLLGQNLFLGLVTAVALYWVYTISRAAPPDGRRALAGQTVLFLGIWLSLSATIADTGWLNRESLNPPPMLRILMVPLATAFLVAWSPAGTRAAQQVGLGWLIGFQVFRIPLELVVLGLSARGYYPERLTVAGWNYDLFVGVTALPVALLAAKGRLSGRAIVFWNGTGTLLLAVSMGLWAMSLPGQLRVFLDEPSAEILLRTPWVWMPLFLQPAALLAHLLVFRLEERILTPEGEAAKLGRAAVNPNAYSSSSSSSSSAM